jgi:hypothetical protein
VPLAEIRPSRRRWRRRAPVRPDRAATKIDRDALHGRTARIVAGTAGDRARHPLPPRQLAALQVAEPDLRIRCRRGKPRDQRRKEQPDDQAAVPTPGLTVLRTDHHRDADNTAAARHRFPADRDPVPMSRARLRPPRRRRGRRTPQRSGHGRRRVRAGARARRGAHRARRSARAGATALPPEGARLQLRGDRVHHRRLVLHGQPPARASVGADPPGPSGRPMRSRSRDPRGRVLLKPALELANRDQIPDGNWSRRSGGIPGGMKLSRRDCATHPHRPRPGTHRAAHGRAPSRPAVCACSARE